MMTDRTKEWTLYLCMVLFAPVVLIFLAGFLIAWVTAKVYNWPLDF